MSEEDPTTDECNRLRMLHERALSENSADAESVKYLATWHLERCNYAMSKRYFSHLATLETDNFSAWISLGISCALAGDLADCKRSLRKAAEVRVTSNSTTATTATTATAATINSATASSPSPLTADGNSNSNSNINSNNNNNNNSNNSNNNDNNNNSNSNSSSRNNNNKNNNSNNNNSNSSSNSNNNNNNSNSNSNIINNSDGSNIGIGAAGIASGAIGGSGSSLNTENDIRIIFCEGLLLEKSKDNIEAMEKYITCIRLCDDTLVDLDLNYKELYKTSQRYINDLDNLHQNEYARQSLTETLEFMELISQSVMYLNEIRCEISLRMAIIKKELGALEQVLVMCDDIIDYCSDKNIQNDGLKSNVLCLKGLVYEYDDESSAEIVYREIIELLPSHTLALERLGRLYFRYKESIPAAAACFFRAVSSNSYNYKNWYLLGRCYMLKGQYVDAFESYSRAVNLNPNDAQIWCSLGVLYYSHGQYEEALGMFARSLRLDPHCSDAWYNVGALYDMCGQSEDAQMAYMTAKQTGLQTRFNDAGQELENPIISSESITKKMPAGGNVINNSSNNSNSSNSSNNRAACNNSSNNNDNNDNNDDNDNRNDSDDNYEGDGEDFSNYYNSNENDFNECDENNSVFQANANKYNDDNDDNDDKNMMNSNSSSNLQINYAATEVIYEKSLSKSNLSAVEI